VGGCKDIKFRNFPLDNSATAVYCSSVNFGVFIVEESGK